MRDKDHQDNATGKPSACSEQTLAAYEKRYRQLIRAAERHFGEVPTPERLAGWLIETKRPTLGKSSWRQYRAATVYGFELDHAADPSINATIFDKIDQLKSTRPAELSDAPLRTSQQKAKRFKPGELDKINHRALSTRSPNALALTNCLNASNVTGLRPCEWPTAQFRRSEVPGYEWEMKVRCAKADDIRAHGEFRTLRWAHLDAGSVTVITDWIFQARQAEIAGAYETLLSTLRALMLLVTSSLFPKRTTHSTLYTPRHEATARWKAAYVSSATTRDERLHGLAIVAALLGHASDATATIHYGRPRRGDSGSSRFPIPTADPDEVARVRRIMHQNLDRFAARRPSRGAQP